MAAFANHRVQRAISWRNALDSAPNRRPQDSAPNRRRSKRWNLDVGSKWFVEAASELLSMMVDNMRNLLQEKLREMDGDKTFVQGLVVRCGVKDVVGNSRTVRVALSFRVPSEAHGLPVYGGRRKGRKVARADRFSEERMLTLCRYTNLLHGTTPVFTNPEIKEIVFKSFPFSWQQDYELSGRNFNTQDL